jgi:hypothetical protein
LSDPRIDTEIVVIIFRIKRYTDIKAQRTKRRLVTDASAYPDSKIARVWRFGFIGVSGIDESNYAKTICHRDASLH